MLYVIASICNSFTIQCSGCAWFAGKNWQKNIICHFLATEVAVYFCNNKLSLWETLNNQNHSQQWWGSTRTNIQNAILPIPGEGGWEITSRVYSTSVWEKRTVAWPHLLKYRFSKDPDVPPTLCWETGTNQMHKTIYSPVGWINLLTF